jgi:hypothetical protein
MSAPDESVYRSRDAVLKDRIRELETELRVLRRERARLPETRGRRLAYGAVAAAIALGALGFALRPRPPEHVELTPMFHNGGWTMSLRFAHPSQCVSVRLDRHDGAPERVGCMSDPHNAESAVVGLTFTQVKGPMTLLVDYEVDGAARSTSVEFDPVSEKVSEVKHVLGMVPQWVEVREMADRRILYFTTLVSYGYALREIRYGLDAEPLDRRVRFTPHAEPGVLEGDELYREYPQGARAVTVQVVFADGTESEIKRFETPPKAE